MDSYNFEETLPACSNCEYHGEKFSCNCKEREEDIKNNQEKKDEIYDFCAYFKKKQFC